MPVVHTKVVERIGRVSKRVIIGGSILLVLGLLVAVTWLELLPRTVGLPLYFIHDHVYLWIKGHFFTRQYPWSIIWWGLAATIIVSAVASALSDRSFIKEPHLRLLRRVVYRPQFSPMLAQASDAITRFSFGRLKPHLMQRVIRREWERNYLALVETPSASNARHLINLTRLSLALEKDVQADDAVKMRQLEQWHAVLLGLVLLPAEERNKLVGEASRFLVDEPPLLVQRPANLDLLRMPTRERFLPTTLGHEVALLRDTLIREFDPRDSVAPVSLLQLVGVVEARRREILDRSIASLEQSLWLPDGTRPKVVSIDGDPLLLPTAGRLALMIAVHVALISANHAIGQAYTEAVEMLDMLLTAFPTVHSAEISQLRALMEEPINRDERTVRYVDLTLAYRILARQREAASDKVNSAANWQPLETADLVTAGDLQLLRDQIMLLKHAGGVLHQSQ